MTKVTANKLLDLVRRSGLVDEVKLTSFLEKVTREHGEAVLEDQNRLAELMIEEGLLTRWQADKLLAGKHKGFRLGKYKLLGQIGKGGMSSVYLAEHELMKRRVAIKVLPQNRVNDSSYLERFRLEARAVAKLDDPNIVRAYDIDNEGNIHYIVMEYVDGQDLHQIVVGQGPLDYDTAADYIAQVANGLQHAHEMGLVHRDIKPANCLVDRHSTVKLLDLGLGQADRGRPGLAHHGQRRKRARHGRLSRSRAGPQQPRSGSAAPISTAWAARLYFLLTGGPPFPEGSISERLLKHQTDQAGIDLQSPRPDAPPSLVDICETMMAKKPDERFQSAGDVAARLKEWLADRGRTIGGGHIENRDATTAVSAAACSGGFALAWPRHRREQGAVRQQPHDLRLRPRHEEARSKRAVARDGRRRDRAGAARRRRCAWALPIGSLPKKRRPNPIRQVDERPRHIQRRYARRLCASSGSSKTRSLIEEELHDPELEQIQRKVAQRAQFNPLQPPGYVPPSSTPALDRVGSHRRGCVAC